jgi:probable phosphoglycerate mutase
MMSPVNHKDPPERTIYLLRHGQPVLPEGGKRYIGQTDLALSPEGERQAEQWRAFFGTVHLKTIFSSDLQRALQTARIIARGQTAKMVSLSALREVNLGAWEGQRFAAMRHREPESFALRGHAPSAHRPPGGESFRELQARVIPAFKQIAAQATGPILIVGHAGVNRVVLCHLLGMPLDHLFRIAQDYAALSIITRYATGWWVKALTLCPGMIEKTLQKNSTGL